MGDIKKYTDPCVSDFFNARYVDFDGVINSYKSGWGDGHADSEILDPPVPGVKQAFEKMRAEGVKIILYTCRCNTKEGRQAVENYMKKHEIPYDGIFPGMKPCGRCIIDDRAMQFNGSWDEFFVDKAIHFENYLAKERKNNGVYYNKIVRDKIPVGIMLNGQECKIEKVDNGKAIDYLIQKLHEEVDEYNEARNYEELADIFEVLFAIVEKQGIDYKKLKDVFQRKAKLKGKFNDNIILKEVKKKG